MMDCKRYEAQLNIRRISNLYIKIQITANAWLYYFDNKNFCIYIFFFSNKIIIKIHQYRRKYTQTHWNKTKNKYKKKTLNNQNEWNVNISIEIYWNPFWVFYLRVWIYLQRKNKFNFILHFFSLKARVLLWAAFGIASRFWG